MFDNDRTTRGGFFTQSNVSIIFLLSLAIYLAIFYLLPHPITILPQFTLGLLSFAVIPGSLVNSIILPKRMQSIWTSTLSGIVIVVLEIQALFSLSLLTGLVISLVIWLSISSLVIVFIIISVSLMKQIKIPCEDTLSIKLSGDLKIILIIAVLLRITMLFLSQESIAPDASLYSDYARNLLNGAFNSTIVNEPSMIPLWNDIQFCEHQAFIYITSFSFILFPPLISGPAPFLSLIGILLIFPVYRISKHHFGEFAGTMAALIVAIHPLFVFHSAVAYGPEITSLLIFLYGFILLFSNSKVNIYAISFAGLLIGLVDPVWYSNFYLVGAIIPIYAFLVMKKKKDFRHLPLLLLPITLVSSAFFDNTFLFISCWIVLFVLVILMTIPERIRAYKHYLGFYASFLAVWIFYRWPFQLESSSVLVGTAHYVRPVLPDITASFDKILIMLRAPISLELIINLIIFLFFHLSIGIILVLIASFLKHGKRYDSAIFLVMLFVASFGTLFVFAGLSTGKDTLIPMYVYSDSRFFLSITLLGIIALSRYFGLLSSFDTKIASSINLSMLVTNRKMRRQYIAFIIIVVGMVPSYLAIPTGLTLINADQRYAWVDLEVGIQQLGDSDTVFLVDRYREFSWLTKRMSAKLSLYGKGIPNHRALLNLMQVSERLHTDYAIIDFYTVAAWRTLDVLLLQSYDIADSVPLETEILHQLAGNSSVRLTSAILEFQTSFNHKGDYSRIFSFGNSTYTKRSVVDLWDSGWAAGNDGLLINISGNVGIQIGSNQNYTYSWRPGEFDLGLETAPGFTLIKIDELNASVSRISFWYTTGDFMLYAEPLGNGIFYSPIGHASIGDIRITIEGESNSSIAIEEISFWQQED